MNSDDQKLELARRYIDGTALPDELQALQDALRTDPAFRRKFAHYTNIDAAIDSARLTSSTTDRKVIPFRDRAMIRWLSWRPLTAAAAGLVLGLFSATMVSAISAPHATAERVLAFLNGSFEVNRLDAGFPRETEVWSGDAAAISGGKLQFIATGSDANDPTSRAVACDVFQLVDLRPMRDGLNKEGDSVLDLTAKFLDARPAKSKPSVTFFCQLFVFKGNPTLLHQSWPMAHIAAIASGCSETTTLGSNTPTDWISLTAKCLVPADADFAVVQIAAMPNIRPTKLESLFVDDITLTLRTQPALPERFVNR